MPFDGKTNETALNRALLIDALRDTPANFTWDFEHWEYRAHCGTAGCACGLAKVIGIVDDLFGGPLSPSAKVGRAIGLTPIEAQKIFRPSKKQCAEWGAAHGWRDVTPAMVADALDAL